MIGPFCTQHFVLTLASGMAVLHGKDAFSILVLSTKKRYSSFLRKIFVLQKICFKVIVLKILKTFKISTDCHIKLPDLSNGELFWKSLVPFLGRTYALSVGFKMKPLRKSVFQCYEKNQPKFYRKTCWKKFIFYCLFDESYFSNICTLNPW